MSIISKLRKYLRVDGDGYFVGNITAANFTGSSSGTSSGTNSGDVTLTAVGSSPSANGASFSGQVLTLQPADATHPGLVTTSTQSFAGNKTFTGSVSASNLSGTNTGDVTLAAFGSTPANPGASFSSQVLTLQPADATHGGGVSTTTQSFAGAKTFTGAVSVTGNLAVDSTVLFVDTANDRVGVGVNPSSVGYKLQVSGGANDGIKITATDGTNNNAQVVFSCGNEPAFGQGALIELNAPLNASAPNELQIINRCNAGILFSTNNSNVGKIVAAGRWLVGTTTDDGSNRLQVSGTIAATGNITGANLSGTNTGNVSLGAVGSSPNGNAASLSTQVLTLQPADASNPGVIANAAQTIPGAKTFGSVITYKGTTGITAFATGGQASATALTGEVNFVTVVASAADSVKLPTSALGSRIVVFNLGANATNIYPQSGGAIDALGTNAAYSLAAGGSRQFWGQSTTQWRSQ